jgi:hypothetical protein
MHRQVPILQLAVLTVNLPSRQKLDHAAVFCTLGNKRCCCHRQYSQVLLLLAAQAWQNSSLSVCMIAVVQFVHQNVHLPNAIHVCCVVCIRKEEKDDKEGLHVSFEIYIIYNTMSYNKSHNKMLSTKKS